MGDVAMHALAEWRRLRSCELRLLFVVVEARSGRSLLMQPMSAQCPNGYNVKEAAFAKRLAR